MGLTTPPSKTLPREITRRLYLLVGCAVLPALLIILYNGLDQRGQAVAHNQQQLDNLAKSVAGMQAEHVGHVKTILEYLAGRPEVLSLDAPACQALLQGLAADGHGNMSLALLDPWGNVLAASFPLKGGLNLSDRTAFKDAVRTKEFSAGDYVVGRVGKAPEMQFSHPVLGPDKELRGVLLLADNLEGYRKIFEDMRLDPSTRLIITDRDGVRLVSMARDIEPRPVGQSIMAWNWRKIVQAREDSGHFVSKRGNGEEALYCYARLRLRPGEPPYLAVLINTPTRVVLAAANRVLYNNLGLLALASILAALVSRMLYQAILGRGLRAVFDSEAQQRAMFESSLDAMVISCPDGRILGANPAAERLFAMSEQEIRQAGRQGLVDQDDPRLPLYLEDEKRYGQVRGELFHRRKNGQTFEGEFSSACFTFGGQVMCSTFIRDITERKRQQRALGDSARELRLLAEAMPQIVWSCAPDGSDVHYNRQWADYTGLTQEQSHGDYWLEPFHPEDRAAAKEIWLDAAAGSKAYAHEGRLRRHDGEYRWWLIRGVPLFDERGAVFKWLGTYTDIDDLKKTEAMLVQARDAADSANKAKSEFLANMSHEIRTPLNGIQGMLQLLDNTGPSGEQREYLRAALQSSKRLTTLLADILDLSRIEAGRLVLQEGEFSLAAHKKAVLELFALPAKEKGLELDFKIGPGMPQRLIGDESRLRQLLFNLVGNAVKFTNKGRVLVEACPLNLPEGGFKVLFTISDTGIGLSDGQLKQVFEPFVQADNPFTKRFQGAGLGLAIVRKLTELMGGTVEVDSTEGVGTTIYLNLPFKIASRPVGRPKAARPAGEPPARGLRVLCVEDDQVNLDVVTRMLSMFGHIVTPAGNGAQALAKLAEQEFDLVIMDVQMPVMDGVSATRAIRESGRPYAGLPVIALTAHAMAGDAEKFLALGMDGYLEKPLDVDKLKLALAKIMDQAG